MMAGRVTKRNKAVLSGGLHPHYRDVTATMCRYTGIELDTAPADWRGDESLIDRIDKDVACVVVQNPSYFGHIADLAPLAQACHEKGALLVAVVNEVVSLGVLVPPGAMGADIVAAEGQSLGNPLNFGGPSVGLFAVRKKHLRQMPGRLCGETEDQVGRRGYVLTLSTREQHIRREKATSNICTNSGLCALAFSIHLSLLGERGFSRLARLNHAKAVALSERLAELDGVDVINQTFFNEFTLRLSKPAAGVVHALAERGVLGGVPASRLDPGDPGLEPLLLVAATETTTEDDMDRLADGLAEALR